MNNPRQEISISSGHSTMTWTKDGGFWMAKCTHHDHVIYQGLVSDMNSAMLEKLAGMMENMPDGDVGFPPIPKGLTPFMGS